MVLSKNRPRFTGFAPRPFDKLFNNSAEMPSNDFMNKIGATLPEQMSFRTPLDNALGSSGAVVNQGSKLADNLGKAGTALGGVTSGLSAANDIANGDYVNGGLNAAKTIATFVPGGQPVAAAIQGAQIVKDLFGGLFGGGNDGSESLNETMNIRRNALNQTKQFAQNTQNQDYSQPIITGGAAPMNERDLRLQAFTDFMNNNPMMQTLNNDDQNGTIKNTINKEVLENNFIPQSLTDNSNMQYPLSAEMSQQDNAQKSGLLDKFINGVSDFSRGYQENRNNGFNPNNLTSDKFTETITAPADTQKLQNYQNSLENDAKFNGWVNRAGVDKAEAIKAIAEGKNSGNADIDEWIKENPDAFNETTVTNTYNKGKMAKLGELAGTIGRLAQNPALQGLIAGGAATALTGNPLYGLGKGYEFANNRAMSNIRRDVLKEFGIDVPDVGTFGNLSNQDVHNILEPKYREAQIKRAEADLEERKRHNLQTEQHYQNMENIYQQDADTRQKKATEKPNKPLKGRNIPGYYKEFVNYKNLVESGKDVEKIKNEYSRLLQKYGNDFMKDAKGIKRAKDMPEPPINTDNLTETANNIQMVTLQAPDGTTKKVPLSEVEYYQKKGAKVI